MYLGQKKYTSKLLCVYEGTLWMATVTFPSDLTSRLHASDSKQMTGTVSGYSFFASSAKVEMNPADMAFAVPLTDKARPC